MTGLGDTLALDEELKGADIKAQTFKTDLTVDTKRYEPQIDGERSFDKVPETLAERQSPTSRHRTNSRRDQGKSLNEDIPVDKKPIRKARKKTLNRLPGNARFNQALSGLAPSIQLYSPEPHLR